MTQPHDPYAEAAAAAGQPSSGSSYFAGAGSTPPPGYPPPPGYGPPPGAYPPPGYGYPPYGVPLQRRTNTLAIVSLVAAFVFAPAGLVTGILALREIDRTGEEGRGLAIAGVAVSAVALVFMVLWFAFVVTLFHHIASLCPNPQVPGATRRC